MTARKFVDLQISTFRGVATATDMVVLGKDPVTPIKASDEILAAIEIDTEAIAATVKDVTSHIAFSREGYVTNDASPTSNIWRGLLIWLRNSGGNHVSDGIDLKFALVDGTTAATSIALTGVKTSDRLNTVLHFSTKASVSTIDDITHLCSIYADGYIRCSIDTSNDQFLVIWEDANSSSKLSSLNLKFNLVDGAAADTNIAITDIETEDTILFCLHQTTKAAYASNADLTSEVVILTDGNIQLTDTATTDDQLWIFWHDAS